MRSYVKYYAGDPERLEEWINRHCEAENVRVVTMTALPGGYGLKVLVAFETIGGYVYG